MAPDNPHQPVGNDGGERVNVNTPIPTPADEAYQENPTTAERHLQGQTADGEPDHHESVEAAKEETEGSPTTAEQHLAGNDADGTPDDNVSVDEAEHVVDDAPTTAEQHLAGNKADGSPESEQSSGAPTEGDGSHVADQQDEGEHRLEESAGQDEQPAE